jgi:hypothetical protein
MPYAVWHGTSNLFELFFPKKVKTLIIIMEKHKTFMGKHQLKFSPMQ